MKLTLEINTKEQETLEHAQRVIDTFLVQLAAKPAEKTATKKKTKPEPTNGAAKGEPDAEGYDSDDIRAKASELIKAGKRAEVKELLKEFGADTIPKLKVADYAAFMEKADNL